MSVFQSGALEGGTDLVDHGEAPRVYLAAGSRWFRVDLRPWDGTRMVMRNPLAPGWPDRGDRTDSPELAERWAWAYLDWIRGERRREALGIGPDRPLHAAVEAYLDHRSVAVERATWSADRTALGYLTREWGRGAKLSSIETADLQAIVNQLLRAGYRASTVTTYVKSWRVFFRAVGGWNPTERITITSRAARPLDSIDTLSPHEIRALFLAAEKVDAQRIGQFPSGVTACAIGLFMGLRMGEIFALQWADIDPVSKTVRVRFQVPKDRVELRPTKGKLSRTALVLPDFWEHYRADAVGLCCGRAGRPVGTRTQRNLITRVLDAAGLNQLGRGWHILRHTYARSFLEARGSLEELQASLGHSSIVTTQTRYGHLRPDAAAALARARIYGA